MPKLVQTPRVVAKEALRCAINRHMDERHLHNEEMAVLVGRTVPTFRAKRDEDLRCFDWEELRVLFKHLKFTDEEILKVMRWS